MQLILIVSGGPRNFFVGGIEGAKCISEGAKIQKFAKNGWFWPFFFFWLGGGGKWGQSLWLGGKCPHAPLDAATAHCWLRHLYRENKFSWSRDLILNVRCHQNFQMLNFYTTYEFLTSYVPDMNYIIHPHFLSTFINRSINILLEFWHFCQNSEHHLSTMFAWELSTTWYDYSIVTYKFQYS